MELNLSHEKSSNLARKRLRNTDEIGTHERKTYERYERRFMLLMFETLLRSEKTLIEMFSYVVKN